jgi:hypothetical protein
MTPAEVQSLVRKEIDRLFSGAEHVTFAGDAKSAKPPAALFYDRFLEVITSVHHTLADLNQRVATVEGRLYDLEQVMRHRGHKPGGDADPNARPQ